MTSNLFEKYMIDYCKEMTYEDKNIDIGIFAAKDGKVCCILNKEADGILLDREDILDKFIINGKSLRKILPTLNDREFCFI